MVDKTYHEANFGDISETELNDTRVLGDGAKVFDVGLVENTAEGLEVAFSCTACGRPRRLTVSRAELLVVLGWRAGLPAPILFKSLGLSYGINAMQPAHVSQYSSRFIVDGLPDWELCTWERPSPALRALVQCSCRAHIPFVVTPEQALQSVREAFANGWLRPREVAPFLSLPLTLAPYYGSRIVGRARQWFHRIFGPKLEPISIDDLQEAIRRSQEDVRRQIELDRQRDREDEMWAASAEAARRAEEAAEAARRAEGAAHRSAEAPGETPPEPPKPPGEPPTNPGTEAV